MKNNQAKLKITKVTQEWKSQSVQNVANIEIPTELSVFQNGKIELTTEGDAKICAGSSGVVSG